MTEIKTSPHADDDRLSFSLSEEEADDTTDSLDIKPPQAAVAHRKISRRKKDKLSSKEDRAFYSKSHHSGRSEVRRKDYKDERSHKERDVHLKRPSDQAAKKERDKSREYKPRKEGHHHKEPRPVTERRVEAAPHRTVTAAEHRLADLRGKLLDKRGLREVRPDASEPEKKRVKKDKRPEKSKEPPPQETEKEREERLQREERKAKLLEAEREMAHRKEVSRRELEARRERHNLEKANHRMMKEIVRKNKEDKSEGEEGELQDVSAEESDHSSSSSSSSSTSSDDKSDKDDSDGEITARTPESAPPLEKSPHTPPREPRSPPRRLTEESPVASDYGHDDAYYAPDSPQSDIVLKDNLPPYLPAIQGCRSVEEFTCLNRIEEGTYGVVYRARDKRTSSIVALKRLKMEKEKEGFPITSLREINTLLKAQHPNIVTVREIVVGSNMDKIFIVMDYVEHDLKSLMETMKSKNQVFVPGEVKCLLIQLLRAVNHLHDNWILHRDLKTSNLLLSHKGILKVGDFGLAREYGSPLKAYTPIVVTLWYRAPELLLQCKEYTTAIDMWSVGCIFGELLQMEALFSGRSEMDQLNRIFKELGTPNEKIWPGYNKLPAIQKITFAEHPANQLKNRFGSKLSEQGLNLLNSFLTYNPVQRMSAEDALKHAVFKELPLPIDPAMFPTWPAKSEQGIIKKGNNSPKAPSGGREYKQLGDTDDEVPSGGFHMGGLERRANAMGAGFSLKF